MLRSGVPGPGPARNSPPGPPPTGLTRGVALDAALAAAPAGKGRRAGLPVRPRDLSFARAVRAVLSAIRLGHDCYQAVTSEIGHTGTPSTGTGTAPASPSPRPSRTRDRADTATRIAPAVITMANTPA